MAAVAVQLMSNGGSAGVVNKVLQQGDVLKRVFLKKILKWAFFSINKKKNGDFLGVMFLRIIFGKHVFLNYKLYIDHKCFECS